MIFQYVRAYYTAYACSEGPRRWVEALGITTRSDCSTVLETVLGVRAPEKKANDPDARAWTRLEQTPAPPAWKPSFTDLTNTCVGRMVGLTAITVGLRPRYVTIFIVMDVAAGRDEL